MAAHSVGRNLQAYNRMLILAPPPNGTKFEQTIGRLHRNGQERPVTVELPLHQPELVDALLTARIEAEFVAVSQSQKLTDAQWLGLDNIEERATNVWKRKNGY